MPNLVYIHMNSTTIQILLRTYRVIIVDNILKKGMGNYEMAMKLSATTLSHIPTVSNSKKIRVRNVCHHNIIAKTILLII
jgi:hypothetical protein